VFQIRVGTVHVRDTRFGQFLRQSALVGLKRPLDFASGLRGVRGNMLNAQLMQGSAHLGVVLFVNFAARHGRVKVMTAPVGVQAGK
jgi:hypothetical protein